MTILRRVEADLRKIISLAPRSSRAKDAAEKALVKLKQLSYGASNGGREDEISRLSSAGADNVLGAFFLACTETEAPSGQGARTGVLGFVAGDNSRLDLVLTALGSIYQLTAVRAVGAHLLPSLLRALQAQCLSTNENVALKVLQTLPLVANIAYASSQTAAKVREEALVGTLRLCFALNERESPVIRRTSGATLAQLVHQLFENANDEGTNQKGKLEGKEEESSSKVAKRTADTVSLATTIFEEFCLIASGKPGNQLALLGMGAHSSSLFGSRVSSAAGGSADEAQGTPRPRGISGAKGVRALGGAKAADFRVRALCIELIDDSLRGHSSFFTRSSDKDTSATEQLVVDACDMAKRCLRTKANFPMVLRLMRLVSTLVVRFHLRLGVKAGELVCMLIRMLPQPLESAAASSTTRLLRMPSSGGGSRNGRKGATSTMAPTPIWHCTLTLEALLQVCEDEAVLRYLFQTFDQAPASMGRVPVFSALVRSITLFLFRFLEDCGAAEGATLQGGGVGSSSKMIASVAGAVVASAAGAAGGSKSGPSTGGIQLSAAAQAAAKRRADESKQTASGMTALAAPTRVRAMMAGGAEVDGVARAAGVGSSHGLGLGVIGIMDLLGEDEPPELIAAGAALLAANCVLSVSKVMSRAEILLIKAQERAPSPSPPSSSPAPSLKCAPTASTEAATLPVLCGMIRTSWPMLLSSLSLLLAMCSDEELVQQVLRGFQDVSSACGAMATIMAERETGSVDSAATQRVLRGAVPDLLAARDAFVAALCKFALPLSPSSRNGGDSEAMVAALVFQPKASTSSAGDGAVAREVTPGGSDAKTASELPYCGGQVGERQPVVKGAVAGEHSTITTNVISSGRSERHGRGDGGVMGRKNVRAMETLFNIAHCLGGTLGSSWATVLDTFQRFDAILAMALQDLSGIATSASDAQSGSVRLLALAPQLHRTPLAMRVAPHGRSLSTAGAGGGRAEGISESSCAVTARGRGSGTKAAGGLADNTPSGGGLLANGLASMASRGLGIIGMGRGLAVKEAEAPKPSDNIGDELHILAAALVGLFEGSHYLLDDGIMEFSTALAALAMENLANVSQSFRQEIVETPERSTFESSSARNGSDSSTGGSTKNGEVSESVLAAKANTMGARVRTVSAEAQPPWALHKLVLTMRCNAHRIGLCSTDDPEGPTLWDIAAHHLGLIARRNASPGMRQFAVFSLSEIIMDVLKARQQGVKEEDKGQPGATARSTPLGLRELLEPFRVICSRNGPYMDSRLCALQAIYNIIQSCGDSLLVFETSGTVHSRGSAFVCVWMLLREVAQSAVAEIEEAHASTATGGTQRDAVALMEESWCAAIRSGFKICELLVEDFLPLALESTAGDGTEAIKSSAESNVLFEHAKRDNRRRLWLACVSCLGYYGKQTADVNISLAAITKLWGVSDHLRHFAVVAKSQRDRKTEIEGSFSKHEEAALPLDHVLAIFKELRMLGHVQGRPEIRHGAISTLFSMITSYGNILSDHVWRACLADDVCVVGSGHSSSSSINSFPTGTRALASSGLVGQDTSGALLFLLLEEIEACALVAPAGEGGSGAVEEALGTDKEGHQVMMVVHHSRNTRRKQWNETRVLLLQGITRVLTSRVLFSRFSDERWYSAAFNRFLSVLSRTLRLRNAPSHGKVRRASFGGTGGESEVEIACCQCLLQLLSLAHGLRADGKRARYGTNMRVINGALVRVKHENGEQVVDRGSAGAEGGRSNKSGAHVSATAEFKGSTQSAASVGSARSSPVPSRADLWKSAWGAVQSFASDAGQESDSDTDALDATVRGDGGDSEAVSLQHLSLSRYGVSASLLIDAHNGEEVNAALVQTLALLWERVFEATVKDPNARKRSAVGLYSEAGLESFVVQLDRLLISRPPVVTRTGTSDLPTKPRGIVTREATGGLSSVERRVLDLFACVGLGVPTLRGNMEEMLATRGDAYVSPLALTRSSWKTLLRTLASYCGAECSKAYGDALRIRALVEVRRIISAPTTPTSARADAFDALLQQLSPTLYQPERLSNVSHEPSERLLRPQKKAWMESLQTLFAVVRFGLPTLANGRYNSQAMERENEIQGGRARSSSNTAELWTMLLENISALRSRNERASESGTEEEEGDVVGESAEDAEFVMVSLVFEKAVPLLRSGFLTGTAGEKVIELAFSYFTPERKAISSIRTRKFCLAALDFFISLCTIPELGILEAKSGQIVKEKIVKSVAMSRGALSFVRGTEHILDEAARALSEGQDSEETLHLYTFCAKVLEALSSLEIDSRALDVAGLRRKVSAWQTASGPVECPKLLVLALLPKLAELLEASENTAEASSTAGRLRLKLAAIAAIRLGIRVLFPEKGR